MFLRVYFFICSALAFSFLNAQQPSLKLIVPVGGNSWVASSGNGNQAEVSDTGWIHWQKTTTRFYTYINVNQKGTLKISAIAKQPGSGVLECTVN